MFDPLLTSLITSLSGFSSAAAADAASAAAAASASATGCHHDDGCGGERSESDDEWTSWRQIYDGGYGYDGPYLYYYHRLFFTQMGGASARRTLFRRHFLFADTT